MFQSYTCIKPKSILFQYLRLATEDKTGTFSFQALIHLPPSRSYSLYTSFRINSLSDIMPFTIIYRSWEYGELMTPAVSPSNSPGLAPGRLHPINYQSRRD